MWTALPYVSAAAKLCRLALPQIHEVANRNWQIAPAESSIAPKAFYLPDQLGRVTGTRFASENFRREMQGGTEVRHAATVGHMLKGAWLIDGAIHKGLSFTRLLPRSKSIPGVRVLQEFERAALCCTVPGNRYFGNWLIDDCILYPLANAQGTVVTTAQPVSTHVAMYEGLLEMRPARVPSAYFHELIVFEDSGQNQNKRARAQSISAKLRQYFEGTSHPGVFILRGLAGERRLLCNERELAEHLRRVRGFKIIDPLEMDVAGILRACAGARIAVGVEGSQMAHAATILSPGASIMILQPPKRFCTVFKDVADRNQLHFGFVVGLPAGTGDDFVVSMEEVERTLDTLPL